MAANACHFLWLMLHVFNAIALHVQILFFILFIKLVCIRQLYRICVPLNV
jgi:hypothetical protein